MEIRIYMEFMKINKEQREIVFDALGLDKEDIKCQYCNKKLTLEKCGIYPAVNTTANATFVCNCPLCIAEYFTNFESNDNKEDKRITELEHMAHKNMSGEDIETQLEDIDPKLRDEYSKLMYGDE